MAAHNIRTENMKDHNFRQYSLMLESVKNIPQTVDKLGQIVNTLKSLVELLEDPDLDWEQNFRSEWWILEEIYAYKLSNSEWQFTKQEKEWINDAITNLTKLIYDKISQYTSKC